MTFVGIDQHHQIIGVSSILDVGVLTLSGGLLGPRLNGGLEFS
jgi:hypothetical protein